MWLLLNENISKNFTFDDEGYTYLLELNKINILVGKNNSGKSYLMRNFIKHGIKILDREEIKEMLLQQRNFQNSETLEFFGQINILKPINDKYIKPLQQIKAFDNAKVDSGSQTIGGKYSGTIYNFNNFNDLISKSAELIDFLDIRDNISSRVISDEVIHNKSYLIENLIKCYEDEFIKLFDKLPDSLIFKFGELLYNLGCVKQCLDEYNNSYKNKDASVIENTFKNYVPLLRSIRHPLKNPLEVNDEQNNDVFKDRIIREYDYNENEINVITGLDFYREYKKKLLGSKQERKQVNEFEKFLSNYFFEGKDVSIIPDEKTYELKINIDDTEDRFIYQVGDGITSLIIIMYNVFINDRDKESIYFIEEPEQSFHPGFQRLFMNIISLSPKFKNCYFFFTTHSNHLIDISNYEFKNVTNYLCKKTKDDINVIIQNEVKMEVIEELGVNPSSVQIANKIIWVEGKYDAFYIRLLLNKKGIKEDKRKYIEEYDYVFVPYGGSNGNLINFSLENSNEENKEFILKAEKINHNFLIIMDDDGISDGRSSRAKKERYDSLQKTLGKKLYKLKAREIENIFPVEVVKLFFKQGLKSGLDNDLSFLEEIKYTDYKNKKLGDYLNDLVKENIGDDLKQITGRESGFSSNGFLYNKSKFHECVLEWINQNDFDYEKDIPSETKEFIEFVEKYIET